MGRKLGQHFLASDDLARQIAALAALAPTEPALEIGGGRGALTEFLVRPTAPLVVAELDDQLADGLEHRFGAAVQVVRGDVIALDLAQLPVAPGAGRWAVVGNLPYYATSAILQWLCAQTAVDRAVLMMQAEVADRLAAAPGGKAYGRLTVMVQYRATVDKLLDAPPELFSPPPKVNSTVVRLSFRPQPAVAVADERLFFALVEHGFRWRRKMLTKVLSEWRAWPRDRAETALQAAGIDPHRRAETLSLEEFARLAAAVAAG